MSGQLTWLPEVLNKTADVNRAANTYLMQLQVIDEKTFTLGNLAKDCHVMKIRRL